MAATAEGVIEALPWVLEQNPDLKYKIYAILEEHFPPREETNRLLKELKEMREESNKRFAEMREESNRRFAEMKEESDKRFEAVDKRFEAMHEEMMSLKSDVREIKKGQDEISINLLPFMRRGGYHFENTVRGVIEMALKIKGGKIEHFIEEIDGEEIERDAYVHNREKILFEIKSRIQRRDVSYFIRDAKLAEKKLGKVRLVMIGFMIEDDAMEYCNKAGIEVIDPNAGAVKKSPYKNA